MRGRWLIVLIVMLLIGGCASNGNNPVRGSDKGDIVIGVGWPLASRNEGLAEGVAMAAEEINSNGGVLGRQIRIESMDDGGTATEGLAVAGKLAENPDTVAVIGHRGSSVSIPASAIYEKAGIVMLTPGSTSPKLTQNGYRYVFRMIPSDAEIGERMARYAASRGYKRVAILYADDEYGRGLANAFEDGGKGHGIDTIDRLTGYSDSAELTRLVREWEALRCDAVFIADVMPAAGRTVADLRLAGSNLPVLGGDGLDSDQLPRTAGAAAEGAVVASIFNPEGNNPEVARFIADYEAKYGTKPGKWAAQGYDAVRLLADAIARAGSAKPADIAQALRDTKGWTGVTGSHAFDDDGELTGKPIVLKTIKNGQFQYSDGQEG
ncbi:ABC transporter substrate-binding protein [Cohnella thailandensis]|uniref:ABC transporter substrate-binding protein n=1 Tax=Cohnella thailandensis TaxID=557557 RepID=A0A841T1F9_9BACL|nr:ABC transporter substrate-binding protein [Cohnella thailandensis]MBP1976711.1 branched-chain amino acid transport system substrate-binding protein [Cohnella thailandensis]